ncbi:MAG TPA: VWA domain-containing protein [Polyangiaceae bacterium]|nr:VWA domain-containing protein [Polyangiaceae bacterium]
MSLRPKLKLPLLASLLLAGCFAEPPKEELGSLTLHLSQTAKHDREGGSEVVSAVTVSDKQGNAVDLASASPRFTVAERVNGGSWKALPNVDTKVSGPHRLDVVVVADNSGSQAGQLPQIQQALGDFAHQMLAGSAEDRVGLVRVSTEAALYQGLTDDEAVFANAADRLAITNGWTALWDGVRLANEALAEAPLPVDRADGLARFCAERTHRAIVAFTDGQENNSSDQKPTRYAGDSKDTTFDDLLKLNVAGVPTPVHWVGIGEKVDATALESMAAATGGQMVAVDHVEKLNGALKSAAQRLSWQIPICFELKSCGDIELRLTVDFEVEGSPQSLTTESWVRARCECAGKKTSCTLID